MFVMWTSASDADSAGDADDAATLNAPKSSKTDSRQRATHTRTYKKSKPKHKPLTNARIVMRVSAGFCWLLLVMLVMLVVAGDVCDVDFC